MLDNEASTVVGECLWIPGAKKLLLRGHAVEPGWRSLECWAALVEANGAAVSRENLHARVWGKTLMDESNLTHAIAALRRAIDPAPSGESYIETVPRIGYRLTVPVTTAGQPSPAPVQPVQPTARSYRWHWAAAIGLAVTAGGIVFGERLVSTARDEREAARLTNLAIGEMRNGGLQNYAAARKLLDGATELRPNLALTLAANAELAARAGAGSFEGAAALAAEAIRLEPDCGECRAIRGYVEMTRFWNWESARVEFDRATTAPGASQQAHLWYGQLLLITNRIEDGMRQLDVAIGKNPAKPGPYVMKGVGHYLAMRYDQALHDLEKAEGLSPDGPNPHFWMYRAFLLKGMLDDAAKERAIHFAKFAGHSVDEEVRLRRQWTAVAVNEGKTGIVNFWLADSATPNAHRLHGYERAIWKTYAGRIEEALDELEAAEKNRPFNLIYVAVDPALAPLRKEPRFRAVLSRLKLPVVE